MKKKNYVPKYQLSDYPDWYECQWRRLPCNRMECKFCSRILKQRMKHQLKGEDPDAIEAALEDVHDNFQETFLMIDQMSKEQGIDLDDIPEDPEAKRDLEPEDFPMNNQLHSWLMKLHKFAQDYGDTWIETESGRDLMWYANYIPVKGFRAYCDRLEMDLGDEAAQFDYDYTRYVLHKSLEIVKKSFEDIISLHLPQKETLLNLYNEMLSFEAEVMDI